MKRYEVESILDATTVSGTILRFLPPGNFIGFRRVEGRIAIIWLRNDECEPRQQLFDSLTGQLLSD